MGSFSACGLVRLLLHPVRHIATTLPLTGDDGHPVLCILQAIVPSNIGERPANMTKKDESEEGILEGSINDDIIKYNEKIKKNEKEFLGGKC